MYIFFHFVLQNGTLRLIDRKKHIFKLSQVSTVIARRKMLYTFDIELSKVDTCKLFENSNYFSKVLIGLGISTSPAGNHSRPHSYNAFGQRGFPLSAQPQKCETKAVASGYKMGSCCACVLSWSQLELLLELSIWSADHKHCSSVWERERQLITLVSSPGTPVFLSPQKPTLPNSNSIWNAWTRLNEFIWTLRCFVGKKAISNFQFLMTFKSIIDSPCLQPESYSILYLAFRTMTFLTDGHYRHNMTA